MQIPFVLLICGLAVAENGQSGWLRYAPLPPGNRSLPSSIVTLNGTEISPVYMAGVELQRGLHGIFGKQVNVSHISGNTSSSVTVATVDEYANSGGSVDEVPELEEDGFWLSTRGNNIQILGQNERGALYGAFEYLSMLAQGNFSQVAYATNPNAPIRWANQWDNLDGSIERGFAGPSILFQNGLVVSNLTRC